MGIYGLHFSHDMWGSYAMIGIGGATICGALSYVVTNSVREWLKRREDIQSPRRKIVELNLFHEEKSAIENNSIATLPNEMIYRIIHAIISIDSEEPRQPRQIEASKNLCSLSRTCKKMYMLVNAENSVSKHLLDCVYRIGSVLFKNIGRLHNYFPKEVRDKAYITDEIFDNHDAFFAPSGRPEVENIEKWNEWMASKKVSIACGIDRYHRRFFAVHVQLEENSKLYEGVLVFFEKIASNDESLTVRHLFKTENFSFPLDSEIQKINGIKQGFRWDLHGMNYGLFKTLFKNGICTTTTHSGRVIRARLVSI